MIYCTDTDLLYYDPTLPIDAAAFAQTLLDVQADLVGSTLTLRSGSLIDACVTAGQVVVLSGHVAGVFPIVRVDSATVCTLTRLQQGLDETPPQLSPAGVATEVRAIVRTFWPQRKLVSAVLERACGVTPGNGWRVLNATDLVRPAALGTLHLLRVAVAANRAADQEANPDERARIEQFERDYRTALRELDIQLDTNNDGVCDERRKLAVVNWKR